MKLVLAGSSDFAIPSLKILASQQKHPLIGVITQPDSKKGRGLTESMPSVKIEALKYALRIWQPESINTPEFAEEIKNTGVDLIVVASYGQLISDAFLKIPPKGCINIHPSLLPKYRGSSPINHTILNGDKQTGITIFKIVKKMDAGPIIKQLSVDIKDNETAVTLGAKLAELSSLMLPELFDGIEKGTIKLTPQDESKVTFAPKFSKKDGEIDWGKSSREIGNQIKALQPWPGVYTYFQPIGKSSLKLEICEAAEYINEKEYESAAGTLVEIKDGILIFLCRDNSKLMITKLKPAGGRTLTSREFISGYRIKIGDKLGK